MNSTPARSGHIYKNIPHRQRKAEKIRRILEAQHPLNGLDILEVGVGSGVISSYFSEVTGPKGSVTGVDVIDERVARNGYAFQQVDGTRLPFADRSFDVVISNHVIEHVGEREQQIEHLTEIARVLRPNGMAYLAVPNRWRLVEPHFQMALLSCLPKMLRSPYVRLRGKGAYYDCEPPGPLQIRSMLKQSTLQYQDRCVEAVRLVAEIEGQSTLNHLVSGLPTGLLRAFKPIYPTIMFLLLPYPNRNSSNTGGAAGSAETSR